MIRMMRMRMRTRMRMRSRRRMIWMMRIDAHHEGPRGPFGVSYN